MKKKTGRENVGEGGEEGKKGKEKINEAKTVTKRNNKLYNIYT